MARTKFVRARPGPYAVGPVPRGRSPPGSPRPARRRRTASPARSESSVGSSDPDASPHASSASESVSSWESGGDSDWSESHDPDYVPVAPTSSESETGPDGSEDACTGSEDACTGSEDAYTGSDWDSGGESGWSSEEESGGQASAFGQRRLRFRRTVRLTLQDMVHALRDPPPQLNVRNLTLLGRVLSAYARCPASDELVAALALPAVSVDVRSFMEMARRDVSRRMSALAEVAAAGRDKSQGVPLWLKHFRGFEVAAEAGIAMMLNRMDETARALLPCQGSVPDAILPLVVREIRAGMVKSAAADSKLAINVVALACVALGDGIWKPNLAAIKNLRRPDGEVDGEGRPLAVSRRLGVKAGALPADGMARVVIQVRLHVNRVSGAVVADGVADDMKAMVSRDRASQYALHADVRVGTTLDGVVRAAVDSLADCPELLPPDVARLLLSLSYGLYIRRFRGYVSVNMAPKDPLTYAGALLMARPLPEQPIVKRIVMKLTRWAVPIHLYRHTESSESSEEQFLPVMSGALALGPSRLEEFDCFVRTNLTERERKATGALRTVAVTPWTWSPKSLNVTRANMERRLDVIHAGADAMKIAEAARGFQRRAGVRIFVRTSPGTWSVSRDRLAATFTRG